MLWHEEIWRTDLSNLPRNRESREGGRWESRCDEGEAMNELDDCKRRKIRRAQQQIHEIMQPFIRMKMDILNASTPQIVICAGKPVDVQYDEETKKRLAQIDELCQEAIKLVAELPQLGHDQPKAKGTEERKGEGR
jgi:hypothetical protein